MNLNEEQKKAARHIKGPALVLAGPGSGKTTVILSRLAYLILEAGIQPHHILTMTFNKAAQLEMENRSKRFLTDYKPRFSTIHSFCNSVVRDYERRQNRQLIRIEGNGHGKQNKSDILKHIYKEVNQTSITNDELEDLINEIGLVKNKMLKNFDDYEADIRNFPAIYEAYNTYKKENLFIDFDDMLTYAYTILIKCPEILNQYRSRYQYIQIDEGQDLSKIQYELVRLLAHPHNNLFMVADDDQSIYGFRGAEPDCMLGIEKDFPHCEIYYLGHNYRSTKNIVDISSSFIKNNTERFDKAHKTHNAKKHDPKIIQVKDEHEQLKVLVKTIQKMMKKGKIDIAILYRNNLSSIAIVDMLEREGIPFHLKQRKLSFFNHWLVSDILSFLKFSLDQTDEEAFTRICYKMNRFFSKEMVQHGLSAFGNKSIIDDILTYEKLQPFQRKGINEVKKEFIRMGKMSPQKALQYIEHSFNYFDAIEKYNEFRRSSYEYLYHLFGILKSIAFHCPSIPQFLERVEELGEMFNNIAFNNDDSGIILSTVHSAKGLEYDCVFMIDLIDEEFPGSRSIDMMLNGAHVLLEEERRLFYVGMTRAKEHLYLISLKTKNGVNVTRSMFIDEVLGCMNNKVLHKVKKGMMIHHKQFGKGKVVDIKEKSNKRYTISIDFGGVKRNLDFQTCVEKGIIKLR